MAASDRERPGAVESDPQEQYSLVATGPEPPLGGDELRCSFCVKTQAQVELLIAGPGVYICDECIALCNEIIELRTATFNGRLESSQRTPPEQ